MIPATHELPEPFDAFIVRAAIEMTSVSVKLKHECLCARVCFCVYMLEY